MARFLLLQFVAAIVGGVLVWPFAGSDALYSVWIGALACVVPNALFALRIITAISRPEGASPATFVAGELIKISATIALLAIAAQLYDGMVWWGLIMGMVIGLKSYVLALFWN